MKPLSAIVNQLRTCSVTLEGEPACDACGQSCLTQPRLEILDDAAAALSRFMWKDPAKEYPPLYKPVLVARVFEKGKPLKVEQGYAAPNGWWRAYGTNVRRVVAWMPLPEPPQEGEAL